MEPVFFEGPEAFRTWLEAHHASTDELWVGFHKKGTGRPSMTWPESVDEALCWGWIDGLRRSWDEDSYVIRFTPRRAGSVWSARNLERIDVLSGEGRVAEPGRAAWERRRVQIGGQHLIAAYQSGRGMRGRCVKRKDQRVRHRPGAPLSPRGCNGAADSRSPS